MADVTTLFNACDLVLSAGTDLDVSVDQTLSRDGNALLQLGGPPSVRLRVEGPRFQLSPDDIAGVYPAPGSEESPDEFLPHIALNRRTLPWERMGWQGQWLALLVVKESELAEGNPDGSPGSWLRHLKFKDLQSLDQHTYNRLKSPAVKVEPGPETDVHVALLRNATLSKIVPRPHELIFQAHMKRVTSNGQQKDTAIVIANRLPDAGSATDPLEVHTALLVSMENCGDLYARLTKANEDPDGVGQEATAMIVLHHWSFTPSRGGDFEQVVKAIRVRPNGGVLRFGNLPEPLEAPGSAPLSGGFDALLDGLGYFQEPLEHHQVKSAQYRGPLVPFAAPPRVRAFAIRAAPEERAGAEPGAPLDYSHAAAFQLGRLLALHDPGILDDLRNLTSVLVLPEIPLATSPLPAVLQKYDWVSNPAWIEEPWALDAHNQLIKTNAAFEAEIGNADPTGVEETLGGIDVSGDLGGVGSPAMPVLSQFDPTTVSSDWLDKNLPEVKTGN